MKEFFAGLALVAIGIACLAAVYGYIANIITLASSNVFAIEEAVRVAGIVVAPVGVIMGLFF